MWVIALVLVIGLPNLVAAYVTFITIFIEGHAFDWAIFVQAGERLSDATLYDFGGPYSYRYSPVAAVLFGLLAPMGITAWRLAHLAALAFLRDWRLIGLALISYPFWFDVETGNVMTFMAVAAVSALRGSRLGAGIYLGLFLLVPRPLALPLTAWIVWKRPGWRVPFAGMFVVHAAAVALTGLGPEWLGALARSSAEVHADLNLAPSALIGAWWVPVGLALAVWLTWRGRLGLASLAASPYWLPYYFLMLLLELVRKPEDAKPESDQRRTQTAAV